MKKAVLFLCAAIVGAISYAQDIYTDFKFSEFPIEFRYPNDFQVQRAEKMSYIISNGISEFYVKGYNVSNRFNADSLQRMFEKDIYNDADIKDLQLREKGHGSLGTLPADRLVLEFANNNALYKVTAFMVYFHINQEYNALLFFFDMGSSKASSYEGLLINMGQTLKWSEHIPYENYTSTTTGLTTEMPVFWRATETGNDSLGGFLIDDGRGRFSVEKIYTNDSLLADKSAQNQRDKFKTTPGTFEGNKFKSSSERGANKEVVGVLSGLYYENVNGLKRPTLLKRLYYKRIVDGKLVEYQITLETPEGAAAYYAPIHSRILEKIVIPGTPYEIPKPEKKTK